MVLSAIEESLKSVDVETPVLLIPDTEMIGLPDNPKEVVAKETDEIPVRFAPEPLKLVAVTTPAEETVTPPTVNEVAVTTPTLKFAGGEILVENPARPDALDILLLF